VADAGTPTFGGLERGLAQRLDKARAGQKVRLVVKADSRAALPSARRSVDRVGTPQGLGLAKLGYTTVEVDAEDAAATAKALEASPGVESVTIARSRSLHYVPNDTNYDAQQKPYFQLSALQAETAWNTAQGAGITIAVLDGGFDVDHPDIDGKIVGTYDAAQDGGGVEDNAGGSGEGHGTATSSTAAAETNNSQGIAGSAPLADLLLVKVADDQDVLDSAYSAAGIRWAADNGADVINMSYGGHDADPVEGAAVAYARKKGVVVVASAGNNYLNTVNYPAAFPGVISVGATNNAGTAQTDWATDGSWVDVAAPGESVAVAVPPSSYTRFDGTSFSSPLVAGMAAVLRSYRPGAPATTIENAIISTTKPITKPSNVQALGHGLVQYQNALNALPADTALVQPGSPTTVSGSFQVSAQSGAAKVRFSVKLATQPADDAPKVSVTVPVVNGTATTTLTTYGLAPGDAVVTAVSCDASSCAQKGSLAALTIEPSAPPSIDPLANPSVDVTLNASAVAPTDAAVKFLIDGTIDAGTDTARPFETAWDTYQIPDGPHTVSAVLCNPLAPTVCDMDNPSAAVDFTVLRLRPTAKTTISVFSPNGDGRRDTATGTYTFDVPSAGTLTVTNAAGATVRGPISLGTKPSGTYAWSWNGKSNAGTVAPDGTYTVVVDTSATKNEQAGVKGVARVSVRLDRTKPAISSLSASPTTFYPVYDGYKDTSSLGVTTKETTSSVVVSIYNSAGSKIRTITSTTSRPAGRVALAWNGKTGGGSLVKAGTFTYRVLVQDVAGNQTLSGKGSVTVNLKKRVKKTASKVIGPQAYTTGGYWDTGCSSIYYDVWQNYPNSHGYFSRDPDKVFTGSCPGGTDGMGDYVVGYYKYTLPTAMQYLSVRVAAYAGAHQYDGDSGFAEPITAWDEAASDKAWALNSSDGMYYSKWLPAADFLRSGRTIHWLAGTGEGNWYDVRNFRVDWTYYVLQ